jgi:AraC family transcriptional regulator
MMGASRVELEAGGARATRALVGRFEVQVISFPPFHRIGAFDFDRPYLVTVLDGAVAKTFREQAWTLGRESLGTLPAGAVHASAFGRDAARVVAVRTRSGADGDPVEDVVRRLVHVRAAAAAAIGIRLAAELRAQDESWPLAAEGLVLELLALAGRCREDEAGVRANRCAEVRDLLHERAPAAASLSDLAAAAGVHPVHLARSFRREYGVSVGDYARRLRLEWAAAELAGDAPLAEIAAGAGFADQSHFTRSFRRYAGTTPGRYRKLVRG